MSDVIDTTILGELKELMGPAFPVLLERYQAQSRQYLAAIAQGVAEGDADKIAKAAHPLKSSSRQLGAMQVHDVARTLETEAKEHGTMTDTLREAAASLGALFEAAIAALEPHAKR